MKRSFRFLILSLLIISLSACVRSIPTSEEQAAETAEATTEGTPSGTSDVIDQIYLFATQTAIVAGGGQITTPPPGAQQTPGAPAQTGVAPTGVSVQPTSPPAAPTSPPIVAPTATPGIPATYVLQKGEFPYCIARRFNVDPGELLMINGLGPSTVTYAGMSLNIPQSGKPFPGNRALRPHPTTYVVRAGDSFTSIACIFGDVDPSAIAYVNNMSVSDKLTPGQTINIP